MEHLDRPSEEDWDERRLWFEEEQARATAGGVGRLSEQGAALMVELQCCFCAGAWVASVLLAAAVVDAQALYSGFPADELTEDRSKPALTVEDHWTQRDLWRRHAKRAVRVAFASVHGTASPRRRAGRG
jgi:hypothetical protein